MPRYALLVHDSPRGLHYDFFLESGAVLKTWALPRLPETGLEIACMALADHRPIYLDYEGPISGDRGMVTRWDRGALRDGTLVGDEIVVHLAGEKLAGRVELRRQGEQWLFTWQAENGRKRKREKARGSEGIGALVSPISHSLLLLPRRLRRSGDHQFAFFQLNGVDVDDLLPLAAG